MDNSNSQQDRWFVDEVLPHEADLRRWLGARFPSVGDVDDIIQEALSRLLRAHQSGPVANPRAFLFVVARNFALNQLRRLGRDHPGGTDDIDPLSVVDTVNSPLESMVQHEELHHLTEAIQSLPARCRQVLTLRKIYGFSQKEVAERLEISVNTVEVQSVIGLRKCIEFFRRQGYMTRFDP